ncbi:uncharacterized protein LOC114205273 [Eumetopias jubatus]|uniref:uncharacterized protein LOC114205273 n=1 Tax=Eumetopias jubatus TaxID=34886 RepID=UPI0010165C0C|nr:uncharacterized protein LOC114205273 [Eumetopias jubatus]
MSNRFQKYNDDNGPEVSERVIGKLEVINGASLRNKKPPGRERKGQRWPWGTLRSRRRIGGRGELLPGEDAFPAARAGVGRGQETRGPHTRGLAWPSAGPAHAQAAPRATPGPPRGEASPAPAPPPAGGATPRPRVRARPRATRLGVRGAAAEAGPGGRQKMARVCRRQQCSVERRGFRQELDSWRHKLIHCVGETLPRPLPALGPPRHRLPWTREGAGAEAIAAPARPPSLARASPSPTPRSAGARDLRAGSPRLGLEHARRPLPSARLPRGGLSGGSACPFPPPFPPLPARPPGAAAGLLWRLAPRRCHLTGGAASGSAEPGTGVGGVLSPFLRSARRLPSSRASPPPRAAARAPDPACTRGGGRAGARLSGVCEA